MPSIFEDYIGYVYSKYYGYSDFAYSVNALFVHIILCMLSKEESRGFISAPLLFRAIAYAIIVLLSLCVAWGVFVRVLANVLHYGNESAPDFSDYASSISLLATIDVHEFIFC